MRARLCSFGVRWRTHVWGVHHGLLPTYIRREMRDAMELGGTVDLVEILKAALFGLVEGITEWLPVSSTGHMLLLNEFVRLDVSRDFWDMFLVVIQLGAILAVLVLFFDRLYPFSRNKSAHERRGTWRLWGQVIVACLPAAIIGIPLDDWMEEHLGSPFVVAAALIVYGIAFIVIENARNRAVTGAHFAKRGSGGLQLSSDRDARIQSVFDMDWGTAIGIGLFQVLSIIPGTSRSGSTIIGGLLLGCSRAVAAEFTFFLAIPVMVGASGLRLVKFFLKGNTFAAQELAILGVGCVVAFVVSMLAIRFLMNFVKKHDFKPFGWYRIVLGVVVIAYFLLTR